MDFKIECYPFEIAEKLLEMSKDMDFADYEDGKERIKSELEEALYTIKTLAQNEYNKDYWRTLYKVLENL